MAALMASRRLQQPVEGVWDAGAGAPCTHRDVRPPA